MYTSAECPVEAVDLTISSLPEDIARRAEQYAVRRGANIEQRLGCGKEGSVFQTSVLTAVKAFAYRTTFARELACYLRLAAHQVEEIKGYVVPRLIANDEELLIIEMEIVSPPFLLDFADAYLDTEKIPDFPDEVLEEWHAEKQEQFGDRWPDVERILAFMQGHYGIHLLDINPAISPSAIADVFTFFHAATCLLPNT